MGNCNRSYQSRLTASRQFYNLCSISTYSINLVQYLVFACITHFSSQQFSTLCSIIKLVPQQNCRGWLLRIFHRCHTPFDVLCPMKHFSFKVRYKFVNNFSIYIHFILRLNPVDSICRIWFQLRKKSVGLQNIHIYLYMICFINYHYVLLYICMYMYIHHYSMQKRTSSFINLHMFVDMYLNIYLHIFQVKAILSGFEGFYIFVWEIK